MIGTPECHLEIAALSDVGTERAHNEDCCGTFIESGACAIVGVADGVSMSQGGEVASQMAIEVTLRACREDAPTRSAGQRLYHVRAGTITQLTKDHTLAEERLLAGFASKERALADRSALTRSVGRELIVSRDRISRQLVQGDVLLLCSDGLYNVLADAEMQRIVADRDAPAACRALIEEANGRGTPDNVTAAVVRMTGPAPTRPEPGGLLAALRRLRGRAAS